MYACVMFVSCVYVCVCDVCVLCLCLFVDEVWGQIDHGVCVYVRDV